MTRRPIIAGNWKMNGTLAQAKALAQAVVKELHPRAEGVEVVLCPPFTALSAVAEVLRGSSVLLGAQDCYLEAKGAYTGEVSPMLLSDTGCRFCIVGHSERRQILGETDALIHKKLLALLKEGLSTILCVGETLEERKAGHTWQVVERQLQAALESVQAPMASTSLVIAYEPVWAIGTGVNATPEQAQEVHRLIREWLSKRFGAQAADSIRIQYGGSVKPENAASLLAQPDVDGALVGGASLDSGAFLSIIEAAHKSKGKVWSTA
jgi:triosephosphate isomerase